MITYKEKELKGILKLKIRNNSKHTHILTLHLEPLFYTVYVKSTHFILVILF